MLGSPNRYWYNMTQQKTITILYLRFSAVSSLSLLLLLLLLCSCVCHHITSRCRFYILSFFLSFVSIVFVSSLFHDAGLTGFAGGGGVATPIGSIT